MKIRTMKEQDYLRIIEVGKTLRNTDDGKGWFTEDDILKSDAKELFVETPTEEAGIGSDYKKSYKFYPGVGFVFDKIRPANAPDNNCGCDMAVLKKVLK